MSKENFLEKSDKIQYKNDLILWINEDIVVSCVFSKIYMLRELKDKLYDFKISIHVILMHIVFPYHFPRWNLEVGVNFH